MWVGMCDKDKVGEADSTARATHKQTDATSHSRRRPTPNPATASEHSEMAPHPRLRARVHKRPLAPTHPLTHSAGMYGFLCGARACAYVRCCVHGQQRPCVYMCGVRYCLEGGRVGINVDWLFCVRGMVAMASVRCAPALVLYAVPAVLHASSPSSLKG